MFNIKKNFKVNIIFQNVIFYMSVLWIMKLIGSFVTEIVFLLLPVIGVKDDKKILIPQNDWK